MPVIPDQARDELTTLLTQVRTRINLIDNTISAIKRTQLDPERLRALAHAAGHDGGWELRSITADVHAQELDALGQLDGAGEALAGQRDDLIRLLKAAGMDVR